MLYPVESLGPGRRIAVWVQGCERRCEGCANPELWDMNQGAKVPLDILVAMVRSAIKTYQLDGVTITGGEPMLQAVELAQMLDRVRNLCDDVLLFTGYYYHELAAHKEMQDLLSRISMLVDGPYIQAENQSEILRGSANQGMRMLDASKAQKYMDYLEAGRHRIDDFDGENGIISVGIHPEGMVLTLKGESQ